MIKISKKLILIIAIAVIAVVGSTTAIAVSLSLRENTPQDKTITLQFDQQTAYFTGSSPLYAIAGDLPAEGDFVERATVKLTASDDVKMQLKLVYGNGSVDIPDLMVQVNGGTPIAVRDGAILYTSQEEEKEATLSVVFYLTKDAGAQSMQKTLRFALELNGEEHA